MNRKNLKKKYPFAERINSFILVDPLTECYNFQYLLRRLGEEVYRTRRTMGKISLLVLDIDYFRAINNTYGEETGDRVLTQFAKLLQRTIRTNDVLARAGEEKFMIILIDTEKKNALFFGQRLKQKISGYRFCGRKSIQVKISIGVAGYPEDGITSDTMLLHEAEKALVEAKERGGNTIVAFTREDHLGKKIAEKKKQSRQQSVNELKKKLSRLNRIINQSLIDMIYGFARTIEAKDHYTGRHVENTEFIAEKIARKLKLPQKEIENIKHAAILHDLGKIGIDEKILLKPGKLNDEEMEKVKKHPLIGAEILKSIHALSGAIPFVMHHHEKYNGQGYPSGLKGNQIPLGARIIALADVYQALTSNRPYRKAFSKAKALGIIKSQIHSHFDPQVVSAFIEIMKET